ncbi:MAG: glycosyltransferase family protein [Vicinamibacteria bacterium]|nr:glycosyltransferase family protein [Vicinamibacteria bacterium]
MSGVWALVTARMGSTRRPGKALADLAGRPLLEVLLRRIAAARGLAGFAFATSTRPENEPLLALARDCGWTAFAGDEDDVLKRHVDCAHAVGAAHVVRITGDNPLTCVETLERLVALHVEAGADYTYVPGDALLMGILSEVISVAALERSWQQGDSRHRSELVTLYIKEHPEEFRIATAELPPELYRPAYRLTVDEEDDVRLMQALFARLAPLDRLPSTREAIALLDAEPALVAINAHLQHKAANLRSVALDAGVAAATRN